MRTRRQMRVTLGFLAAGIAVLVAAAFSLREPLREQYYLWKLESGDVEGRKVAAESLAEMGSVRAIPPLIDIFRGEPKLGVEQGGRVVAFGPNGQLMFSVDLDGDGNVDLVAGISESARYSLNALVKIGAPAVPHLARVLANGDAGIRARAAWALGAIGPEAVEAAPDLEEALQDESEMVRQAAAEALNAICSGRLARDLHGVVPALDEKRRRP